MGDAVGDAVGTGRATVTGAAGTVAEGLGGTVGEVMRRARRRAGGTYIRIDEDGIAEPSWSYVARDGQDEQEAAEARRPPPPGAARRERRERRSGADLSEPRRRPRPRRPGGGRPRRQRSGRDRAAGGPPPSRGSSGSPAGPGPPPATPTPQPPRLLLPPAPGGGGGGAELPKRDDWEDGQDPPRRRRERYDRSAGRDRPERKVYSVWDAAPEDGDVLDRIGSQVAEAADQFLWGDVAGGGTGGGTGAGGSPAEVAGDGRRRGRRRPGDGSGAPSASPAEEADGGRRHWRDRMADRLDSAMGVHEQGSYYKKWKDRIEVEVESKVGTDPEDWVMARHANQRRMGLTPAEREERARARRSLRKRSRGGGGVGALLAQDSNLMSVLLGRTPVGGLGGKDLMEHRFGKPLGTNALSTILRMSLQTALALFTNTCRWASVRGSLPQPVVVFFVSAAYVVPKRRRLLSAGLAVLALRTVAEALHGYIYGDEDWEDDPDHLYYQDDDEDEVDLQEGPPRPYAEEGAEADPSPGSRRGGRRRNGT